MAMTESQYYGGSALEARDGWAAFYARQQVRQYGCTIRRENNKIIITPNEPPNISSSRPPELAVAQVTGSRPAAAEHGR